MMSAFDTACRVETLDDDVMLVSVKMEDGSTFRGALLKVKSWICPSVPLLPKPEAVTSLSRPSGTSVAPHDVLEPVSSSITTDGNSEAAAFKPDSSTSVEAFYPGEFAKSSDDLRGILPITPDEKADISWNSELSSHVDVVSKNEDGPDGPGVSLVASQPGAFSSLGASFNSAPPVVNGTDHEVSPEVTEPQQERPSAFGTSARGGVSSDYAALQHRWSYFQKNAPYLPKKNIISKREREKLEQTPKLRPRNFLCARCKFALPGFQQPVSASQSQQPFTFTPVDSDIVPAFSGSDPVSDPSDPSEPLSPSHARKRKLPMKRSIVRPLLIDPNFVPHYPTPPADNAYMTQSSFSGSFMAEEPPRSAKVRSDKQTSAADKKRPVRKLKHSAKDKLNVEDAHALATILSSPTPSTDNGPLKIKFKLLAPPSVEAEPKEKVKEKVKVKVKPKKHKKAKVVEEKEKMNNDDDDEFMWPPKLRIDENPDGTQNEEDEAMLDSGTLAEEPTVSGDHELAVSSKRPMAALAPAPKTKHTGKKKAKLGPLKAGGKPSSSGESPASPKEETVAEGEDNAAPKPVARSVEWCITKDARRLAVGDVIWGKLTGYPWWPGKINHIVVCDDPELEKAANSAPVDPFNPPVLQYQEAQVEWFGQKSSISYIEVNQLLPYKEFYDKNHKPKYRTAGYPEAIRLANDALTQASSSATNIVVSPPSDEEVEEEDVFSQLARETIDKERQRIQAAESAAARALVKDLYEDFETPSTLPSKAAPAVPPPVSGSSPNRVRIVSSKCSIAASSVAVHNPAYRPPR